MYYEKIIKNRRKKFLRKSLFLILFFVIFFIGFYLIVRASASLLIENPYTNNTNYSNSYYPTRYGGQTFTTTADQTDITQVDAFLRSSGTVNWTAYIYADGGSSPGSLIDSKTISFGGYPSGSWATFTFDTPVEVNGSTMYWLVISRSGSNGDYYNWVGGNSGSDPYAGGLPYYYNSGWSAHPQGTNYDHSFKIYGNDVVPDEITVPTDSADFDINEEITISGTCGNNGSNNYILLDSTDNILLDTISCSANAFSTSYTYDSKDDAGSHNIHLEYGTQAPYQLVDEITITINSPAGTIISPADDSEYISGSYFQASGTCNLGDGSELRILIADSNPVYVSDAIYCNSGVWTDDIYNLYNLLGDYTITLVYSEDTGEFLPELTTLDTNSFSVGLYTDYWVRIDHPEDNGTQDQYTVNPDSLIFYGTTRRKSSWELKIEKATSASFTSPIEINEETGFVRDLISTVTTYYDFRFNVDSNYNWYRLQLLDGADVKFQKIIYVAFDVNQELTTVPIWTQFYPEYFGYGNSGYLEDVPEIEINTMLTPLGFSQFIQKVKTYFFGKMPLCIYENTISVINDNIDQFKNRAVDDDSYLRSITVDVGSLNFSFTPFQSNGITWMNTLFTFSRNLWNAVYVILLVILAILIIKNKFFTK